MTVYKRSYIELDRRRDWDVTTADMMFEFKETSMCTGMSCIDFTLRQMHA